MKYDEDIKHLDKHLSRASLEIIFCIKLIGENHGINTELYKSVCNINQKINELKEVIKNEY